MKTLFTFLLLSFASVAYSATYYIDYNSGSDSANGTSKSTPWKRCPGMTGFAGSYTHAAGDQFIFKGGVTWLHACLPLIIGYSGGSGNPDQYTVDQTWYAGGAWAQPIFDGEQLMDANGYLVYGSRKSDLLINNLSIKHTGNQTNSSGSAIMFAGGSNIEVAYCTIQPDAIQAFVYDNDAVNSTNFSLHHCLITNAGRYVIYGQAGTYIDGVKFYNNICYGSSWGGSAYHLDGLMVGDPITSGITSTSPSTVRNIEVYNNVFRGDWHAQATAQYYSNGGTENTLIYNNVFSFETSQDAPNAPVDVYLSPGFIVIYKYDDGAIKIYNNTLANDARPSRGAINGICLSNAKATATLEIRNNIFSKIGNYAIFWDSPYATITIDYNLYYSCPSLLWYQGAWASTSDLAGNHSHGFDLHSPAIADPKYVAVPNGAVDSGNWNLRSSSPAINVGVSLAGVFSTDIMGTARAQGAAWDIGAFQVTNSLAVAPANAHTAITTR